MAKPIAIESENDRVRITTPRARNGEDPTLFVGINGVNYLIPKGQAVDVLPEVAEEIERAQAAEARMYDESDALKAKA